MTVLNCKLYYFLGVGGIGMSALARFFNHHKCTVVGYDRTATVLTGHLEEEGIRCHFSEDEALVKQMLIDFQAGEILVVYTPAVPKDHAEYRLLEAAGCAILKRSQVLGEITRQYKTIAIAGTHGKTTTTALVTHILKSAGINCFSFMGGISKNYNTNLLLGDSQSVDAWMVVEADEYDRSFLTLHPHIAVITSADADHLDIYGDASAVKESYELFAKQVLDEGCLVVKKNVDNELRLTNKHVIYSLNLDTEYCAQSIRVENTLCVYDVKNPVEPLNEVTLGLPGLHNVENSVAAVAVAQLLGIKANTLKEALRSFRGVKRRFEYRVRKDSVVYIDDYAHHPEELKAAISSVRVLYPDRKITGIFQPHLFSRTRDFADAFAESLDLLDECILMEIYPAREKPIEGITAQWLLQKMKLGNKKLLGREKILEEVRLNKKQVLLSMGAGDIDTLVLSLEKIVSEQ